MKRVSLVQVLVLLAVVFFSGTAFAQTDPGVRTGAINGQTGATTTNPLPLTSVTAESPQGILEFFQNGLNRFQEVEVVSGGANNGLGPRFNFNQCSGCHSQPSIGGSGPSANIYPDVGPNPESQVITQGIANGRDNTLPSFITATGPTREARFPFFFNANGSVNTNSPNGGVEDLFTVSGRSDAGSCNIPQPSFATAQQENDIIFRIPTPTFGAGLVENIDDSTLLAIQTANANNGFGISGTFNHNGNDGTISRFGWKAQNKSLEIFAGEAYNVEMGITNELFTQDRPLPGEDITTGLPANCLNLSKTGYPEDATNFAFTTTSSDQFTENATIPSDVVAFAMFMRLLAPPVASTTVPGGASSISSGKSLFSSIGCATCHTVTINSTQNSNITSSLANQSLNPLSDIEIHHMGTGLADNVSQGSAGGDQFRSAPLWGLGQRIFFLHDGRTSNLLSAIGDHSGNGSEANTVISNFDSLSPTQQQNILNYLRSL
ncbi:MAG: di-heme oxidoredictase family protein [Candidatus Acidiferrales bacterium]